MTNKSAPQLPDSVLEICTRTINAATPDHKDDAIHISLMRAFTCGYTARQREIDGFLASIGIAINHKDR